ncbi:Mitochondrial import inner membrane translocase subunit tim23 [Tripterygium wilfordii]|uniref:Mitochondrial import inner membrane translocase subunit tim23 n=1 Tax=Tripterygium wilfordii TaxID=458696 RepID=A0A7J7D2D8_TRIWF|nr:mitochondrial import inner membrane translocase subunit TIM23-3-like [Tripterygium wilfordii]XP_038714883.1 mitochondrial import inner membrane translocase subunit TIM23-3-like [Tripterygium wilfordii]KAF5740525.1 Mitochondrial import inner membrane translocase subunit tim23 [Tripterygium wilfordii]
MADPADQREQKYRQYHPYQSLYDVPINNLYNLPTSPEILFDEEAAKSRRSWGENLQYYTGCGYLAGSILGGAKGSLEGLRAAEAGDTFKLRLNRVLNSGGQIGRRFGNSFGVVGLIFAGLESGLYHYRDSDDVLNSVLAGLGTGALYRAAKGPRSAAIAGAVGGITAAMAVAGKHALKRYVPI